MRVIFASTPVGPLGSGIGGGVELTLRTLADEFVRRGHVVDVVAPRGSRLEGVDAACTVTPGFESPTISSLHDPAWVAVRAMVPRRDVHRVMDELYDLGARGILVTAIHASRL